MFLIEEISIFRWKEEKISIFNWKEKEISVFIRRVKITTFWLTIQSSSSNGKSDPLAAYTYAFVPSEPRGSTGYQKPSVIIGSSVIFSLRIHREENRFIALDKCIDAYRLAIIIAQQKRACKKRSTLQIKCSFMSIRYLICVYVWLHYSYHQPISSIIPAPLYAMALFLYLLTSCNLRKQAHTKTQNNHKNYVHMIIYIFCNPKWNCLWNETNRSLSVHCFASRWW